ncbi:MULTISPECIES: FmdB family zinc ribbon protein [unclassified Micromonospora]|uniref:FmdB family zinc ribbon protein n=1 Tax=unclassified Micromonospora TaxID=2617518 RepID=UPI00103461AC|nr:MULTISPECIES: FmdB family zinc ribbon protein [unclassified Micromonospora]QKW12002.1 FmdB family transcriptional regulator [Verrucosispora sp. NA02020]TBL38603.1 FmdB family transcriptional regulator [Verrucosispora sp. SN26_14.1]
MPTYQYACTTCGHQLEAVQSFSDEPLTDCPACEGRLRKVFNSVGIVFKGSGFYRTDSRSNGSASTDTTSSPSKSGTSESSSSSTGSTSSSSSTSGGSTGSSGNSSGGGTSKAPAAASTP